MDDSFAARNELEHKLVAAQDGLLDEVEVMHYLMETPVFMPVKDSIGITGFSGTGTAVPLTLQSVEDSAVLILFSSAQRGTEFLRGYPGCAGGLLAEFRWVLERTGTGVGISINPNWPVGFDLEPEMIEHLRGN